MLRSLFRKSLRHHLQDLHALERLHVRIQHPHLPRVLAADALQEAPHVVVPRAPLDDSDGERAAFRCGFADGDHWHVCVPRYILRVGEGCVYGGGGTFVLKRHALHMPAPFGTGWCVMRVMALIMQ